MKTFSILTFRHVRDMDDRHVLGMADRLALGDILEPFSQLDTVGAHEL